MFWKYLLFECELLLHNRRNWLLGIALLLFFPIYFFYYSQTEPKALRDMKNEEAKVLDSIFLQFSEAFRETEEGEAIYNNLTQQSSVINMQRFSLWKSEVDDKFIEDGLKLNELRLQLHEMGNKGISPYLVVPKEEIFKENALLQYFREHELPLQSDPFVVSKYLPIALNAISNITFFIFVLLAGSGMLLYEQQNRSIVNGFPISFMNKINAKVAVHFLQVMFFLFGGLFVGGMYVYRKTVLGNFAAPILLFQDGDFIAVSTTRYLTYLLMALALIALLLLYGTALLNVLINNVYATVLILIVVFLLPDIWAMTGFGTKWLDPIKYVDIGAILSGDLAVKFGNNKLDYKHAFVWLIGLNVIVIAIHYGRNKLVHIRKADTVVKSL